MSSLDNALALQPLEGRSAGFKLPGQNFQLAGLDSLCISVTRCSTLFSGFLVLYPAQSSVQVCPIKQSDISKRTMECIVY